MNLLDSQHEQVFMHKCVCVFYAHQKCKYKKANMNNLKVATSFLSAAILLLAFIFNLYYAKTVHLSTPNSPLLETIDATYAQT